MSGTIVVRSAHNLRLSFGILLIGLVHLHPECGACMPRIKTDYVERTRPAASASPPLCLILLRCHIDPKAMSQFLSSLPDRTTYSCHMDDDEQSRRLSDLLYLLAEPESAVGRGNLP